MHPGPAPIPSAPMDVEARLIELSRALSAGAKLRQLGEMIDALRQLGRADLRRGATGLAEREILLALAERRYGPAWVRQHVPAAEHAGA